MQQQIPEGLFTIYGLRAGQIERIRSGLLNTTFFLENDKGKFIVQRVSPVFKPEIHNAIYAVTSHLATQGLNTQRLVQTLAGTLCWKDKEGKIWRVLTYLEGQVAHRVHSLSQIESAARVLAKFHRALEHFDYDFPERATPPHDTQYHAFRLVQCLRRYLGDAYTERAEFGKMLLSAFEKLSLLDDEEELIVAHGDLKISNVLFQGNEAVALIDFDTLGVLPFAFEMGDAARSWCAENVEDAESNVFNVERFSHFVKAYAEARPGMSSRQLELIWQGVRQITLELAMRFCIDSFEESYFAWDPENFETAAHHQLCRAKNQWKLFQSICEVYGKVYESVEERAKSASQ